MNPKQIVNAVRSPLEDLVNATGLPESTVVAAAILLAGIAAALVLERIAERLVRRATALLGSVGGAAAAPRDSKHAEDAVGRTVYWLVVVFAVMAATERLGMPVVTSWLSGVASYLPRVAAAVVVVALGAIAARISRQVVTSAARSAHVSAAERLGRFTQTAVLVGTALVAVEQLGIEISFLKTTLLVVLAALLGGAAIAFGLCGRELVANILSAHYVQKIYQPGQMVRIDGLEGRIARITETAVIFECADGEVIVPARSLADTRSTLLVKGGGR